MAGMLFFLVKRNEAAFYMLQVTFQHRCLYVVCLAKLSRMLSATDIFIGNLCIFGRFAYEEGSLVSTLLT